MSPSPGRRLWPLVGALAAFACSPGAVDVSQDVLGGGGGANPAAGAGTGGGDADAGAAAAGPTYPQDSFFAQCSAASTTLSGTAFAPNGTDPVSAAEVDVYAAVPSALDRGVVCESCTTPPSDVPLASAIAGPDGKFTVNLDRLGKRASYVVTVRKARFRRVLPSVAVSACANTALTAAQTSLPKTSAEGDLPRIAISSGARDHLEKVVTAMGVAEFDCVKGLSPGSSSETCTRSTTLGQLLGNLTLMKSYGLIFIACAPADTYEPAGPTDVAAQNLRAWVAMGGKLVVTDLSYDFVEQAFPGAIVFAGASAAAGLPQPRNVGEVGTATASLTGTVSDPALAAWLTLFPGAIDSASHVALHGFLSDWAVQKVGGPGTRVIVHGAASFSGGPADVPLTSSFEVSGCGRVIFSSYHTDSGGAALLPQERILEYLLLEVGACVDIN